MTDEKDDLVVSVDSEGFAEMVKEVAFDKETTLKEKIDKVLDLSKTLNNKIDDIVDPSKDSFFTKTGKINDQKFGEILSELRTYAEIIETDTVDPVTVVAPQLEETSSRWFRTSEPPILVPQKAVPSNHKELAEIKRVIESSNFTPIPISQARARVKPLPGEGYNDYVARCSGFKSASLEKSIERDEAIEEIAKISKALLRDLEAGAIIHVSQQKTLKEQLIEYADSTKKKYVDAVKQKVASKKAKIYCKVVRFADKLLGVGRTQ